MLKVVEQKGGVDMAYDYSKLRGRIAEKYKTQYAFAKKLGWSERTLSLKLNGKIFLSQSDIESMAKALEIKREDIQVYFFTIDVQ